MATVGEIWLDQRDADAPEVLRDVMRAALREAEGGGADGTVEQLAVAAAFCLRRAVELGASRQGAWPLLAADALLTYACEAAAEETYRGRTGALAELCRRVGPAGLEGFVGAEQK